MGHGTVKAGQQGVGPLAPPLLRRAVVGKATDSQLSSLQGLPGGLSAATFPGSLAMIHELARASVHDGVGLRSSFSI